MTTITTRSGKGTSLTWDEMDANFTNLNTDKAEIASPTFTGTPAVPTAAVDTNTTQAASTAFVINQGYAKTSSPTITTPTLTNPTVNGVLTVSNQIVTTQPTDDRNMVINGGFTINQRGYVSGTTLSAGSYGHDRWKAGSSGGDYTFTQSPTVTTITIASSKTLIQVIEDVNVNNVGGATLSWTGTAQARVGVNGAAPSGAYAASPITNINQSAGQAVTIEFNSGTLSKVLLETGNTATVYPNRSYSDELAKCLRYYYRMSGSGVTIGVGRPTSASNTKIYTKFPVAMRTAPSAIETDGTSTRFTIEHSNTSTTCTGTISFSRADVHGAETVAPVASGLTIGHCVTMVSNNASAYVAWSAEL